MNILLNNYCNLQCEYCFAKDVLEQDKETLSLKDFNFLLDFTERSHRRDVRWLGGEPLMHPEFPEILNMIFKRKAINQVVIFTNGVLIDKYMKDFAKLSATKKISFTINVNDMEQIGKNAYDRMVKNIKALRRLKVGITLGINLYKPGQEFQHIVDLTHELKLNGIRWSLTVPNSVEKKFADPKEYYTSRIPLLKAFFTACAMKGIQPHVDCNSVPICMYDDELLRLIALSGGKNPSQNLSKSFCHPVIDVEPDLNAIRCFGFSDEKIDVRDFKDLRQLSEYFDITMQGGNKEKLLIEECRSCVSYKMNGESCGCLAIRHIDV